VARGGVRRRAEDQVRRRDGYPAGGCAKSPPLVRRGIGDRTHALSGSSGASRTSNPGGARPTPAAIASRHDRAARSPTGRWHSAASAGGDRGPGAERFLIWRNTVCWNSASTGFFRLRRCSFFYTLLVSKQILTTPRPGATWWSDPREMKTPCRVRATPHLSARPTMGSCHPPHEDLSNLAAGMRAMTRRSGWFAAGRVGGRPQGNSSSG
jgi:hypothetical protein